MHFGVSKNDVMRSIPLRSLLLLSVLSLSVPIAITGAQDAGIVASGTVTVEQSNILGATMAWTLLSTDQQKFMGSEKSMSVTIPAGSYTFFIEQPEGFTTEISLFEGDQLISTSNAPQITFQYQGQSYRISVHFSLVYTGKVGVLSSPTNVPFILTGPNNLMLQGVTPTSYDALPVGLYSVRYQPRGCNETPPKSDQLEKDGRVDFQITIQCEGLSIQTQIDAADKLFVNASVDGKNVVFHDVPLTAWFATYVSSVAKRSILSGYRNPDGSPSDKFGPENFVTLAELVKITHRIAGLDEKAVSATPANATAKGWEAPFIASAEANDWVVFIDPTLDVNRPATRAEVVETLMQALNIPVGWPTGKLFSDVTRRTPYAAAIETAARDGIVSGTSNGVGMVHFDPTAPINRASMAKIVTQALAKYRISIPEQSSSGR